MSNFLNSIETGLWQCAIVITNLTLHPFTNIFLSLLVVPGRAVGHVLAKPSLVICKILQTSKEIEFTYEHGRASPVLHIKLPPRPKDKDEKVEKKAVLFHLTIKNVW